MDLQFVVEKAAIAALCSLALGWAQAGSEGPSYLVAEVSDSPALESEVSVLAGVGAPNDSRPWAQAFGQVTRIEAMGAAHAAALSVSAGTSMPKPGSDLPSSQPAGGYRVTVRMDSGTVIAIQQPSIGSLVTGSRVKLVGGSVVAV